MLQRSSKMAVPRTSVPHLCEFFSRKSSTGFTDPRWLIKASFVPGEPTQQMCDPLRTRKQFVRERTSHQQRIQKTQRLLTRRAAQWLRDHN
jgi:hypothetical protein